METNIVMTALSGFFVGLFLGVVGLLALLARVGSKNLENRAKAAEAQLVHFAQSVAPSTPDPEGALLHKGMLLMVGDQACEIANRCSTPDGDVLVIRSAKFDGRAVDASTFRVETVSEEDFTRHLKFCVSNGLDVKDEKGRSLVGALTGAEND